MNNQPETPTTCKHCGHAIYPTANGGWCHVGNATSSPMTCYAPDGSQRIAIPANVNESLVPLHDHYARNAIARGHANACELVTRPTNWPTIVYQPACTCGKAVR